MREALLVADRHQARIIKGLTVRLGPLCGMTATELQTVFAHCAAGTIASCARLEIRETPLVVHCNDCNSETEASPVDLSCARCGSPTTRLVSGGEVVLEHVDLGL
jgi:hydrogenase nickel incorporation protein HypA/HybF